MPTGLRVSFSPRTKCYGISRGRNKARSCIATSKNGADAIKYCKTGVFVGVISYTLAGSVNVISFCVKYHNNGMKNTTITELKMVSKHATENTLKHLKRSYIFRSYDHPQGAYSVPC